MQKDDVLIRSWSSQFFELTNPSTTLSIPSVSSLLAWDLLYLRLKARVAGVRLYTEFTAVGLVSSFAALSPLYAPGSLCAPPITVFLAPIP